MTHRAPLTRAPSTPRSTPANVTRESPSRPGVVSTRADPADRPSPSRARLPFPIAGRVIQRCESFPITHPSTHPTHPPIPRVHRQHPPQSAHWGRRMARSVTPTLTTAATTTHRSGKSPRRRLRSRRASAACASGGNGRKRSPRRSRSKPCTAVAR